MTHSNELDPSPQRTESKHVVVVGTCDSRYQFLRILSVVGPFDTFNDAYKFGEEESFRLRNEVGTTGDPDEKSVEFDVMNLTSPKLSVK